MRPDITPEDFADDIEQPKQAVIYARASPRPQSDKTTIAMQIKRCQEWCQDRGIEVIRSFADSKVSGKDIDRPALNKAIDVASRNKAMLVSYDLSRLVRSLQNTIKLFERLKDLSIEAAVVSGLQIDTTSPAGRMMLHIISSINEYFREQNAMLTREALAQKKASGSQISNTGYGYRPHGNGVVADRMQQRVIRWILWRRSLGYSISWISRELSVRGYDFCRNKTRKNKYWTRQAVQNLFYKWKPCRQFIHEPVALDLYDRWINWQFAEGRKMVIHNIFKKNQPTLLIPMQLLPDIDGQWPHKHSIGDHPVMNAEGLLLDSAIEIRHRIIHDVYQIEATQAEKPTTKKALHFRLAVPSDDFITENLPELRDGWSQKETGPSSKQEPVWQWAGIEHAKTRVFQPGVSRARAN